MGVVGIEGSDGPELRVSLRFYWKLGHVWPNEVVLCQQLGCWVLHAMAGRIVLNVTGRMEASVGRGRGEGAGGHCFSWPNLVRKLGRVSTWERPSA